jgi:hypothetical protein
MQLSLQPPHLGTLFITPYSSVTQKPKGNGTNKATENPVQKRLVFDSSFVATASPTFIPPSERGDLPQNLLVTSVEIDWRRNQGRSSRQDVNEETETLAQEDNHAVQVSDPSIDWTAIETTWDKQEPLHASMELLPDTIVAWKAVIFC